MKVLVTGSAGLAGSTVLRTLESRGIPCRGLDAPDFDVTKDTEVRRAVEEYVPDVIVHCPAYTDVDRAESEPETCALVNGFGALVVARAAAAMGARMLFLSSAQVFPGTGDEPAAVSDAYGPKNVFGMSMVQAEDAVRSLLTRYYIVRSGDLFGGGKDAVRSVFRAAQDGRELKRSSDRRINPTWVKDLARVICELIATDKYGIWHVRNEGDFTPAEFARLISKKSGRSCRILPLPDAELPLHARRPLNCRLAAELPAGFEPLPSAEDALDRYLNELSGRSEA